MTSIEKYHGEIRNWAGQRIEEVELVFPLLGFEIRTAEIFNDLMDDLL